MMICPLELETPRDFSRTTLSQLAAREASWLAGVLRRGVASAGGARPWPEGREARIRLRAYLKAQQRGFAPGGEVDDWIEAEREIDAAIPDDDSAGR